MQPGSDRSEELQRTRFDELAVLVAVAESGSLSAAAQRLGVPKSTVGRAIARIEEDLGVALVRRMARGQALTEPGRVLANLAAPHVAALRDVISGREKALASMFNEEGHPAPHDGGRGNKLGRGWGHTSIRAMLLNERYIGRITWNQSKWVSVPGRKSRRRVARPESEWVTQDEPALAIITADQRAAARARFQRVHQPA